jgi:tetratricopeptide (TPR) repeat protein
VTLSQHLIKVHNSKYSIQQDIEMGREFAKEFRQQNPMLKDAELEAHVNNIGKRLVDALPRVIPEEFMHPEFEYSFDIVDKDDIQAYALPGGSMFLHRGMLDEAPTEGGIAGIMAHEISHVALRHGTAGATRGEKFQWGALAGAVVGAIIGGSAGDAVADLSRFGLGLFLLKYSRDYEKDADLLGSQIMFEAGYDPRDLATMFTLMDGQGSIGWLSSHPNPGNRAEYIRAEAGLLEERRLASTEEALQPPVETESLDATAPPERKSPEAEEEAVILDPDLSRSLPFRKVNITDLQLRAKEGHAEAQFQLGDRHENGLGVLQDYQSALSWYTRAAEQRYPAAQARLAQWYLNGDRVRMDTTLCHMWANLAAVGAEGELLKTTLSFRNSCEANMTLEEIEHAQGLAREWLEAHPAPVKPTQSEPSAGVIEETSYAQSRASETLSNTGEVMPEEPERAVTFRVVTAPRRGSEALDQTVILDTSRSDTDGPASEKAVRRVSLPPSPVGSEIDNPYARGISRNPYIFFERRVPEWDGEAVEVSSRRKEFEVAFQLGSDALSAGNYRQAVDQFQFTIDILRLCYQCYQNLGSAHLELEADDEAEAAFKQVIAIRPDYVNAYINLSTIYNRQRRFAEAAEAGAEALRLSSGNAGAQTDPIAVYNQGIVYMNSDRVLEAKLLFEQAISIDPTHADAHFWLGMTHLNVGDENETLLTLERYLELVPNGQHAEQAREIISELR